MKTIGTFAIKSTKKIKSVKLSELNQGVNDLGNHIVKVENSNIEYIINKICNHAGGRLIIKGEKAVCPMHDWQLNLKTLKYNDSHVCKETMSYQLSKQGDIIIEDSHYYLENPFKTHKKGLVNIRWLNHATVLIECNGVSIITDPWLFGPAFVTGWWLSSPSPLESIELLKTADYVFVSHNHPDHLHAETLSVLNKNTKIIVADFQSKSSEKYLKALGFTNITSLSFNQIIEIGDNFQISILKSGDFRDDSGIYICANGHEILMSIDANFLNNHVLPNNIDLLMTSFAGGASGFPLCYENFTEDEKEGVLKRNKSAIKVSVAQYIQVTKPKYYMPYAGMFKESSYRDQYILEKNLKNAADDFLPIANKNGVNFIAPLSNQVISFINGNLIINKLDASFLIPEDTRFYIEKIKSENPFNPEEIIRYFQQSNFKGNQIVQIIPTDDNFGQTGDGVVYADFKNNVFKTISTSEIIEEKQGYNVMQLKIRSEIIMTIINNKLPWEDFSIGFQMRVKRSPNHYESDFWYHFTNVYIGLEHFRASSFCGSCTVINQNPIWIV